ncbi:ATP-dependent zinc metalloprotease FtsH [Frateuria terrea]|uniref:ATP-dependent zinc metalloprotease FtsH n=1 Tax=Frateuria terrea TaxID=529704 RepID=A0A1H6UQI4_9GAMM|nr:ATP-dependent zinc metalloprotease FtsH [Frateuria terrea]SEI93946.1 cell division protease FtsH [Frateuria terrea]SFP34412.1 membrane protease FtsH catalytic subunit [Frateuria terrea]
MDTPRRVSLWYLLIPLIILVGTQLMLPPLQDDSIAYSQFRAALAAGRIERVQVGRDEISGTFKPARPGTAGRRFTTVPVEPRLADTLAAARVEFSAEPPPGSYDRVLPWLVGGLVLSGLWLWSMGRATSGSPTSGLMSVGKSKAKVYLERGTGVTFADVAGEDEAKDELKEVISFLRNPKQYGRLGARMPKGILLVGPPGTGKTLLARAVAGEAGVPFFSISGSEFVELFVGVGAARVRDLFEQARAQAPCIIFIDELDAVGRARGASLPTGGHDEKEQTLNQLLKEMDGFDPSAGVVLLAATNRPEILDPALLRAGRFDRQILVDRPDKRERVAILRVHLARLVLGKDVNVEEIAALTTGFSGADLANLANEAALLATRRGAQDVGMDDLTDALERVVAGLEKHSRVLSARERRIVAFHEVGHALVSIELSGDTKVQKLSIVPRGIGALGYTIERPTEDRFLMQRQEITQRLAMLLGGRAAELMIFGEASTGAADDLAKATGLARAMVTHHGMAAELGTVSYETDATPMLGTPADAWQPRRYAEVTAAAIDRAVRQLLDEALLTATDVLRHHRVGLEAAAEQLLLHETLSGDQLKALVQQADRPTDVPPAASSLQAMRAAGRG